MRRLGPLRNVWEGGWNGEGFIGVAKPEMVNEMQKNWPGNVTNRVMRKKAFDNVLGYTGEELSAVEETKRAMKSYDCWFAVENRFKKGRPLSVVEVTDRFGTRFGCVIGDNRFVPLKWMGYKTTIAGLAYHKWEIGVDTRYMEDSNAAWLEWDEVTRCAVMLPMLGREGFKNDFGMLENPIYAIVDSHWNKMDRCGRFGYSN
jgi:hypothetical protein